MLNCICDWEDWEDLVYLSIIPAADVMFLGRSYGSPKEEQLMPQARQERQTGLGAWSYGGSSHRLQVQTQRIDVMAESRHM